MHAIHNPKRVSCIDSIYMLDNRSFAKDTMTHDQDHPESPFLL